MGLWGLLLAGLVFLPGMPSFCPLRVLFHLPCPSCGMTRAVLAAAGGHAAEASHLHPLWPLVPPLLGVVGAAEAIEFLRTAEWGRVLRRPLVQRALFVALVLLVAVWALRFFGCFGGPVAI
jgi:hypothetical protein